MVEAQKERIEGTHAVTGTQQKGQGSTIGDYRILKTIGYGGFGVVKLVESMADGKQFAMKVFEPEGAEKDRINTNT